MKNTFAGFVFLLLFQSFLQPLSAQNTRISDFNTIGWYNYFGTFRLNSKLGIHTEYQFRRENFITHFQQSLLRFGLNYQLHPRIQLRFGYAWAETFAYGDLPINGFGKDFTEHRIFEMATITDKIGRLDLSHRFMLEQRWIGKYANAILEKEDLFPLYHRARYMLRLQVPLKGKSIENKTPYVAVFDEVFLGFGKNVTANIFDQNRIGILLGYKVNGLFKIEGGYLNQTLQFGRLINSRNVFQYNNGLILNAIFNVDLEKKE